MAEQILAAIHRTQLPFKLDANTRGDGNCFSRGVVQQCQRETVRSYLEASGRNVTTFMMLKKNVCEFMLMGSEVPMIVTFKREFEARQREARADTWEQYWQRMMRDGEWADHGFIQATSWYLYTDIHLIPTTATPEQPLFTIRGNYNSETQPCPGPPLLLGYINGLHYQSVLPINEEQERPEFLDPLTIDRVLKDVIIVFERELKEAGEKSLKEMEGTGEMELLNDRKEEFVKERGTKRKSDEGNGKAKKRKINEEIQDSEEKSLVEENDGKIKCIFCQGNYKRILGHLTSCKEVRNRKEDLRSFKEDVEKMCRKKRKQAKKVTMATHRARRSGEEKEKEKQALKVRMATHRARQSREDKEKETKKDRKRKRDYRAKKRSEAQNNKYQQTKKDNESTDTKATRRKSFMEAVVRGPIYICSCCHRRLFQNSVEKVTDKFREKIKSGKEDLAYCLDKEVRFREDGKVYICSTCKAALSGGRVPAMAVVNGLHLFDRDDRPNLTELEMNLIAHNINFQKMVLLPKSRWSAGKGRMVSVPVGDQDIMNTAKMMPRLPSEAGLIPIKLKRKKVYKGHERREMIRPEKIFEALQYLKQHGHPSYQFYESKEEYLARCKEQDRRGHQLLMGEDDEDDEDDSIKVGPGVESIKVDHGVVNSPIIIVDSAGVKSPTEDEVEDELEVELKRDQEDIQNDVVRRQHFDYSENSVLVNGHPEIFLNDDGNQVAKDGLDFAPAEGKVPQNFLDKENWDVDSWPTLHPDGKFGRDHKRKVKLTPQQYFLQRILNKDDRFAKTPGYVFAAMSHVEAARLRCNANLSGYRGKKTTEGDGQTSYVLKDPFSVFDGIPGTPKYWRKVKYDMIAKLENIGPFHWFFTLSCGDLR